MYTKLSLCFTTLSLATIVGNCAPVTPVPAVCLPYLHAIRVDINQLEQILPDNELRLNMPSSTGRPCARATVKSFKKALNDIIEGNDGNNKITTITQNILDNIDAAWKGIEEENEESTTRQLSPHAALREIKTFVQQCYKTQTSNTACNN